MNNDSTQKQEADDFAFKLFTHLTPLEASRRNRLYNLRSLTIL